MLLPYRHRENARAKQIVHTMTALHAPDQLRQRVAWALSQVLVIGDVGSVALSDHSEVWTSFYDILVRHAFGTYRDILSEGARRRPLKPGLGRVGHHPRTTPGDRVRRRESWALIG